MSAGAVEPAGMWVDDSSSWVKYTPPSAWGAATDPGRDLYDNTYHFSMPSSSMNPNATVQFTFPKPGTQFQWRGFQSNQAGLFAVCVDCSSDWVGVNSVVVDTLNASSTTHDGPVTLYSDSGLSNDIHNVTICNLWDVRTKSWGQITVDSFIIQGSTSTVTGTQSVSIPTVSSTTFGLPGATSTMSVVPASSGGDSEYGSSSGSTLSHSQIAGIVVGAVAAMALVVLVIALCMRSRSRPTSFSAEAVPPAPGPGISPIPDGQAHSSFGLSLFAKKDPKEPTPFILPAMAGGHHASRQYPYLHNSAPHGGYAQSINPPTISEHPSPPQSPVKDENGIRRWPSLSTSSGEEPQRSAANPSMSSLGSIISSIRLPRRMRSSPMNPAPANNIRMQPAVSASQPPNPRNIKFFIANASPAPRPIPEETPVPPLPWTADTPDPTPLSAPLPVRIRPLPAPISTTEPTSSSAPPTGRGRSFKSTPPRSGKRAMGPRPLSSPHPSGQSRQSSGG
ncbi:hypothetical protein CALVIDRAFT_533316 [Calocera viscosa TUFC12733]|uniref:Uncharacterized protein n=1 Tax=Calocera viscosa (strain TUFC12733) TaxID=1330018 RepID=A0A167RKJ0_CALVF|nr:hypothetical protein CALVIDRAFT_533316 [Calocera viscosa TUFC12733]